MRARKKPRGITLPDALWSDVVKNASLIKYNHSYFMETCVRSIIEMINEPEKRKIPLIVRLVDAAKANAKDLLTVPLQVIDDVTINEQVKDKQPNVTASEEN